MAAIDRGETRSVICRYRGLYGNYSRKWLIFFLDLAPAELVLHHYVLFRGRVRIPITEALISASLRPPASPQEARHIGASGQYAPGGSMELVGQQIVSCKTTGGIIEFAVRRTDVALLLHYVTKHATKADASPA